MNVLTRAKDGIRRLFVHDTCSCGAELRGPSTAHHAWCLNTSHVLHLWRTDPSELDPPDLEYYEDYEWSISCPGVTDACRTWWECFECQAAMSKLADDDAVADYEDELYETEMQHGVEHRHIHCGWARKSDDCWVQVCENTSEAVDELVRSQRLLIPGEYAVIHESEEEYMELFLEKPVGA